MEVHDAVGLSDRHDLVSEERDSGIDEQLPVRLRQVAGEVRRSAQEVARPARQVGRAESRQEESARPEPGVDTTEQRGEKLPGNVVQDVEGGDRVERAGPELDRREVGE